MKTERNNGKGKGKEGNRSIKEAMIEEKNKKKVEKRERKEGIDVKRGEEGMNARKDLRRTQRYKRQTGEQARMKNKEAEKEKSWARTASMSTRRFQRSSQRQLLEEMSQFFIFQRKQFGKKPSQRKRGKSGEKRTEIELEMRIVTCVLTPNHAKDFIPKRNTLILLLLLISFSDHFSSFFLFSSSFSSYFASLFFFSIYCPN